MCCDDPTYLTARTSDAFAQACHAACSMPPFRANWPLLTLGCGPCPFMRNSGKPFMVMAKLGTTLSAQLPRPADTTPLWVRWPQCHAWPLSRALSCALQLASALAYCHDDAFPDYRVLHRDVKPNNVGVRAQLEHHYVHEG